MGLFHPLLTLVCRRCVSLWMLCVRWIRWVQPFTSTFCFCWVCYSWFHLAVFGQVVQPTVSFGSALLGSGAATWAKVVQLAATPRQVGLVASYPWSDGSGKLDEASGLQGSLGRLCQVPVSGFGYVQLSVFSLPSSSFVNCSSSYRLFSLSHSVPSRTGFASSPLIRPSFPPPLRLPLILLNFLFLFATLFSFSCCVCFLLSLHCFLFIFFSLFLILWLLLLPTLFFLFLYSPFLTFLFCSCSNSNIFILLLFVFPPSLLFFIFHCRLWFVLWMLASSVCLLLPLTILLRFWLFPKSDMQSSSLFQWMINRAVDLFFWDSRCWAQFVAWAF